MIEFFTLQVTLPVWKVIAGNMLAIFLYEGIRALFPSQRQFSIIYQTWKITKGDKQ